MWVCTPITIFYDSRMHARLFFAAVADKENRVSSTKSHSHLINNFEQQRVEIVPL